jgi:hypothetical protein
MMSTPRKREATADSSSVTNTENDADADDGEFTTLFQPMFNNPPAKVLEMVDSELSVDVLENILQSSPSAQISKPQIRSTV